MDSIPFPQAFFGFYIYSNLFCPRVIAAFCRQVKAHAQVGSHTPVRVCLLLTVTTWVCSLLLSAYNLLYSTCFLNDVIWGQLFTCAQAYCDLLGLDRNQLDARIVCRCHDSSPGGSEAQLFQGRPFGFAIITIVSREPMTGRSLWPLQPSMQVIV